MENRLSREIREFAKNLDRSRRKHRRQEVALVAAGIILSGAVTLAQQSGHVPATAQGRAQEQSKRSPQSLSNSSIVKLVQAGLGEGTIISLVDAQPGNYSLGVDDIVALKKAGVSDKVIAAMLKKTTSARAKNVTSSPPSASNLGPEKAPKKDRSKEFSEFQPVVPVIKDENYYLQKHIDQVHRELEGSGSYDQQYDKQNPKDMLDKGIGFFRMLVANENKLMTWYEVDKNHPDAVAIARDVCGNRSFATSLGTKILHLARDIQDHKVVLDHDLADGFKELVPLVEEATRKRTQLEGMGFSCPD